MESEGLGKEAGGGGDEVVAGVALALQLEEAEAVEVAVLFLEALAEGTHILRLATEATDEGHAIDTAAGLFQAGEAATERSGHIEGILGMNREFVGKGHDDGLAAVVALLMELAGTLLAVGDFVGLHRMGCLRVVIQLKLEGVGPLDEVYMVAVDLHADTQVVVLGGTETVV